jgi:hypothetical protein
MISANSIMYAIFWFAIGALVGAQWTRMRHQVRHIAQAQAGEGSPVTAQEITDEQTVRRRRWPRRLLDTFIVLLFVGSAAQAYYQDSQTRRVADCTNAYSDLFADSLEARSSASASAQQALDVLMETVGQLTTGTEAGTPQVRAKFRAALDEYLLQRTESKKQQAQNPFPPPPRDLCK